jgi:hypothetical protein
VVSLASPLIRDVLRQLEDEEKRFAGQILVAPVLKTRRIAVRISGIWCRLSIQDLPTDFQGFGVFEALSATQSRFLRPASLAERLDYLGSLPSLRLIALAPGIAWPANSGDTRFRWAGPAPLLLAEPQPATFETVVARFDGRTCWFEGLDSARDPSIAAYLREQLFADTPTSAEALRKKGLTREERDAYAELLGRRIGFERSRPELRLRQALGHGGAELVEYLAPDDEVYTVRFRLDEREYVSAVRVSDLTLVSAGICLSGEDNKFDLASLAGVLREGRDTNW